MTSDQLPDRYPSVQTAIEALAGEGAGEERRTRVGGGCIANGAKLDLSTGESVFVKSGVALAVLEAEARGLLALRDTQTVRVPEPLAIAEPSAAPFLILEYISPGSKRRGTSAELGHGLARMHRSSGPAAFGLDHDNFIGSTPQMNAWKADWITFFAENRLTPQIELAARGGLLDASRRSALEQLVSRLPDLLPAPEAPSILHGDLWGGNWMCDSDGRPWIIDPAVYYGHREADLAMTELFGGFDARFYAAYEEAWPLDSGYRDRVSLYNLYHVLNHVNLFGAGYLGQVDGTLRGYR